MANWNEINYDPTKYDYHKGWNEELPNGGYPDNYFFADTIRSIVIGFGQFFNRLFITHYDKNGVPVKILECPLKFGPRGKAFDFRVEQDSKKKYYLPLPNITYRIESMTFDGERYTGANETRAFYNKYFEKHGIDYNMADEFWSDIQPIPYNIGITMDAYVEYMHDGNQILEQILRKFSPESYIDLKEFWFCNIRRSIKIKLESSNIEVNTDFGEEDKREIHLSFSFVVEAFIYNKIGTAAMIDKIITKLSVENTKTESVLEMYGNYDGSLTGKYNFSEQFGTKIGYVSAVKNINTISTSSYDETGKPYPTVVTTYEYVETSDVKNYPWQRSLTAHRYVPSAGEYVDEYINDSVLLTAVSSIYNTDTKTWDNISGVIPLSGYGQKIDNYVFKNKPVDLTVEYIPNAPYVVSSYETEKL